MGSETFYLKYRPQRLKELDLEEVSSLLQKVVSSGKTPHAFLFVGPRGIGKTSAARILAKVFNCLKRDKKSSEPCNRCSACLEITAGNALDLLEIDAASNRGIDEIRDLKEKIKLSPAKLKYKVFIIDEVHMLTMEAFNALLKTLEEPPAHTIFILCTTAPEKLPETIISRCLKFNFRKATPAEVVKSLKKIVKGEKLQVETGVLEEISQATDGSFRDAHKILDQLVLSSPKVTLKNTQRLLGQSEEMSPEKLLGLLVNKDVKAALAEINRAIQAGADLSRYLSAILEQLRICLLAKVGAEGYFQPEALKALSQGELGLLISLFSQAASEIKWAPIPQLPIEIAAIEFCGNATSGGQTAPKVVNNPGADSGKTEPKKSAKLKEIENKWEEILTKIKPLNHSVEALLKASRPLKIENDFLTLEVFYRFHKERLETEKCRMVVEGALTEILGIPLKLKCILGQKPMAKVADKSEDILDVASTIFNS